MNRSWLAAVPLVIAISFVILSATQSSKRSERSDRGAQPSADTGVGDRARDPKESGALERAREASDDAAGQATIQAVDGVTGRPIAGATVLIHVPGSTEEIRMRSDANGRCTFACDENTTGVVCAPGYAIKHWERYGRGRPSCG